MRPPHETALRAWVAYVLGLAGVPGARVIYSDGGGPRPAKPYASLLVSTDGQTGEPEHGNAYDDEADEITNKIRSQREGVVGVQVYGLGHHALATLLDLTISRQDVQDLNTAAGLTVAGAVAGVTRVSSDTDNVIEDRSVAAYSYRYSLIDEQTTPEYIATAVITETYLNG